MTNKNFNTKRLSIWDALSMALATLFFLSAAILIFTRFWQGFIYLIIGAILLPKVHGKIENLLRFKFTWLKKTAVVFSLIIIASILSSGYDERDERAEQLELTKKLEEEELVRIELLEKEKREKNRVDSLEILIAKADSNFENGQFSSAISFLTASLDYAKEDEKTAILNKRASYNLKGKNFEEALLDFSFLIEKGIDKADNLYYSALCYEGLNNRKSAVKKLKQAIFLGQEDAAKLHDKINPIRKRFSHYVTRCCDGTTSSAKGRGACSHHGGVCNWKDPIYQEYRKY